MKIKQSRRKQTDADTNNIIKASSKFSLLNDSEMKTYASCRWTGHWGKQVSSLNRSFFFQPPKSRRWKSKPWRTVLATVSHTRPAKEGDKRAGGVLKRGKRDVWPSHRGFLNTKILKTTSERTGRLKHWFVP